MGHDETLRRISRAVEILAASGDGDATWFAEAVATWRARPELALEQALGLPSDWRERERRSAIDVALNELVANHYRTGLSLTGRLLPEEIAQDLGRFAATDAARLAARPDGKRGLLWDLLRNRSPTRVGGLRKVLRALRCSPPPLRGTHDRR